MRECLNATMREWTGKCLKGKRRLMDKIEDLSSDEIHKLKQC